MHQGTDRLTAAAGLALALACAGVGSAVAAPGDAASAPDGASVSYAAGSQYTVRPGQSLNDVAIAVTQSHDRGTLARASRALFDANPNAFMSHDPSRMRVGALLTVPALDASGAPAASAPVAGSASVAPSAAAATAAPASAPNAAAAGAASAAAPATPAVSGTASSTAEASPATPGSATAASAVATAPVAGSQAAGALSGSQAHVWSGAIQPSASEPAEGASVAATAQPASQPRAQVSSLQQLLALKNRVLMELQKHGIGGSPVATVKPATSGAQPAAGVSSAAAGSGHGGAAISASNDIGISQTNLSVAAAVGAALVVLLGAWRLRRRKRARVAAAEGSLAKDAAAAAARAAGSQDIDSTPEAVPVREATDVVPEQAAAARAAEERAQAERGAAEQAAAEHEAAAREPHADRPAQDRNASQHAGQESHAAPAPFEPAQPGPEVEPAAQSGFTSESLPAAHHENLDGATTAASLAAAAELGAEALPRTSLEPVNDTLPEEVPPHRLQWDDEPASGARLAEPTYQPSYEPQPQPQSQSQSHQQIETATPGGAPDFEPVAPVAPIQPALSVPTEFPRDAVDAFSSLDMPLPPRLELTDAAAVSAPGSLATQPVASPETTAQQAIAPYDADDAPHIADEIAAGTAGHAAVAGLGAAGFGALKLDFDLELPPSPAQPLPAFTQADLTRIARNKLDLAAEYIDLGDLSGARVLINEVIEANDPATRTEARALLSTLAPLS